MIQSKRIAHSPLINLNYMLTACDDPKTTWEEAKKFNEAKTGVSNRRPSIAGTDSEEEADDANSCVGCRGEYTLLQTTTGNNQ